MTKGIRIALATVAGAVVFALGYMITAPIMLWFLELLAGDPEIYKEVVRDFQGSPLLLIFSLMIGSFCAMFGGRKAYELLGRHGLPGLIPLIETQLEEVPLNLRIHANGKNELGDPARLEIFKMTVQAGHLLHFMHGGHIAKLLLRNQDGLYLELGKRGPSPYDESGQPEDTMVVRVRSKRKVIHSFETVYGATPTFTVQEGKPIAFYRIELDYLGSETDVRATLHVFGPRKVMEAIFLHEPPPPPADEQEPSPVPA